MDHAPKGTSPKQPQPERRRDWYPYYAGFTEDFAAEVLCTRAASATRVIDPWNGSGTTTAVCARHGVDALGLDINPVMTIIARARLTPSSIAESLEPLGEEIIEAARRLEAPKPTSEDPLATWMRPDAVARARAIQAAIHIVLEKKHPMPTSGNPLDLPESLPILACFYYTALFATARDVLRRFRTSNPTWVSLPAGRVNRIRPSWRRLRTQFTGRIEYLAERLMSGEKDRPGSSTSVRTGSAARIPDASGTFDACITSPPYATRIDYVKSLLPELAVLGVNPETVTALRRTSTGSPLVKGVATKGRLRSDTAATLVKRIKRHDSHGSLSYYFPWMWNYLRGLQDGLREIARVLATNSPIYVVVQDSHYKELHVDLQQIVVEMLHAERRKLIARQDYAVAHNMARLNPAARKHLPTRDNCESLLEFR